MTLHLMSGLLMCVLAMGVAGCAPAGLGPDQQVTAFHTVTPPAQLRVGAIRSPNEQGRAPARSAAPGQVRLGSSSARGALNAFAVRFINWNWRTVRRQERALARSSVDGARAQLRDAAGRASELEGQRAGNSGTVRAITRDAREPGSWLIVTRERSSRQDGAYDGVGAQWHLTLAAVRKLPSGRWAVSAWIPQT